MVLLAIPALRVRPNALYGSALLAVMGFVVQRLNVSITGFESALGSVYVPAWSELAVTLMLVALGFGVFGLAVRYLRVYPDEPATVRA
jgi:Ni/Fe-hydrogenase subunit HybB-like protein